jgi:TonB family protein
LILVVSAALSEAAKTDHYAEAIVLWQADLPTCFPTKKPLHKQMEAVDSLVVGGEATPPRKVKGGELSKDLLEGIEISSGVPVLEVVINAEGIVESVVLLRQTTPEFDAKLAQVVRKWKFEPATLDGQPICTRYIVTLRINYK